MNIFFTQLQRRIAVFGLLAVLLTTVVTFQTISFSSLAAVRAQTEAVSGQYTTIAVPVAGSTWTRVLYEDESTERTSLMRQSMKYPGLLSEDRRAILKAHVTGCESISAYEKDYFSNNTYDMFSRALAVLAVRCTSATEAELPLCEEAIYDENGEITGYEEKRERYFSAEFSLESVVSEFPAYAEALPPTETIILSAFYPPDGKLPFEEGKTYLLFGNEYPSSRMLMGYDENNAPIYEFLAPNERTLFACEMVLNSYPGQEVAPGKHSDFLYVWSKVDLEDGVFCQRLDEGSLPYCAEYTGTVEEFLDSNDGVIWRDTILSMCKANYESAEVVLTDNLESMLWFNTGDASVFDGRSFEPQEYANGENVCLVSVSYAIKNGLSVGQTVELDLYGSTIRTRDVLSGDISPTWVECNVYEPCKKENRLGVKKDYKIIGIYSAPDFGAGEQNFTANTIFIPKASVPNADRYEDLNFCLLYSLILENGKADEFEAALKERDCGGMFAYFDQNYNMLAETLDVMEGNAVRMVLISSALFVLVAALFFFLFLRQTADPARKLRLLGVRAGTVRRQRYGAAVVLILVAAVLGAAGGAGLYGAVTKRVLSGNIALQPTALLLAVAAQTVILLIAALLCTLATARQNLMQKK